MNQLTIEAKPRVIFGKLNKKLRQTGMLPAVVYGRGKKSINLEISAKEFEKVYRQSGENTLVNLKIEGGEEKKVLIHDVAKHFMKNVPIHVDFYEVDLSRKIRTKVPLHFVGESGAVRELGGILVKSLNELEIEALPTDLPQAIEVNIEGLKTFDDLLRVGSFNVGDKVKILNNPEEVIVSVQEPRSEEELAELEKPTVEEEKEAIEAATKEEEGEEKKEGEEERVTKEGEEAEEGGKKDAKPAKSAKAEKAEKADKKKITNNF